MEAIVFYLLMLQKYVNSMQKDSVIKSYPLSLRNILEDFLAKSMKKKKRRIGLNGCVDHFPVDYKTFATSDIIDIFKHLMKKHNIK